VKAGAKRSRASTTGTIPLVKKNLPEISRALLEGENREKFASFLREHEKNGLYALYKKNGELYYVGRASDLLARLRIHRSDLHGKNWDKLAIYIIESTLTLHEVESLLIAVSKPPGNTNRGRLKGDLKKALKSFLKTAALEEINASLYPNQKLPQAKKSHRITDKKIENFVKSRGVLKTADILGVSQGRVSQLRGEKRLREWIIAAGKREKMLDAIETARPRKKRIRRGQKSL
jgi:GIY-YIG catalytic domain